MTKAEFGHLGIVYFLFFVLTVCSLASCGPDDELSIMLVFEQQSDIDVVSSVWVAALIPKDNTKPYSCSQFLNGERDPHSDIDARRVSEISSTLPIGTGQKLLLPSVGKGERLFYAETYFEAGVLNDSGCTDAIAGQVDGDGKQEIVIHLGDY